MTAMLVVQFGLAYYAQQVFSGAAQDGAANGARRDSSPEAGRALAEDLAARAGSSLVEDYQAHVSVEGDRVVVTVSGDVVSLIPFRRAIRVEASGSAPIESFRPQREGS